MASNFISLTKDALVQFFFLRSKLRKLLGSKSLEQLENREHKLV